jgi:hypothetical protein
MAKEGEGLLVMPPADLVGAPPGPRPDEVLYQADDPGERPFTLPLVAALVVLGGSVLVLSFLSPSMSGPFNVFLWGVAAFLFFVAALGAADRSHPIFRPALTAVAVWRPPSRPSFHARPPEELRYERMAEVVLTRVRSRTWVRCVPGVEKAWAWWPLSFFDPGDKVRPLIIEAAGRHGLRVKQALARGEEPLRLPAKP